MDAIKAYVVSLKDSQERRENTHRQLSGNGISYEFVDAVDLRKGSTAPTQYYAPPQSVLKKGKHLLTPPEIGCSLSHFEVYRRIVAAQQPIALVFEDDVKVLRPLDGILSQIDSILAQTGADVIILGGTKVREAELNYYYRRLPIKVRWRSPGFNLGTPWEQYGCGTVGYLITQQGAQKILSAGDKVQVAADNWLYFEKTFGLKILHARPFFVAEECEAFDSTIRVEKANFLKVKPSSYIIRSAKGILKNFAMNRLGMK